MTKDTRINVLNIGLMIISCIAAFLLPFEVFLFAYAFMGPLHYLTEISWLHDRQYFTKGKYDFLILLSIGALLSFAAAANDLHFMQGFLEWYNTNNFYGKLLSLALFGAIIMAFVKNHLIKIVCLLLIFIFVNGWFMHDREYGETTYRSDSMGIFVVSSMIPTLIHVYIFTGLFMLYGALKSRSKSGLWSIVVFVLCPVALLLLFQNNSFFNVTEYGKAAYYGNGEGFWDLNFDVLKRFSSLEFPLLKDSLGRQLVYQTGEPAFDVKASLPIIFNSKQGVLLQRFIAFAYTYHYLNWFSKTEIIRWHKVPKGRFIAVIVLWVGAVGTYIYDYTTGLKVLFFLSFCHVLLEFPLNWTSIVGIFKEVKTIRKNGFKVAT